MQLDALTLAALNDELEREARGARVDDVIQPTPHSIALQLWGGGRNRWLVLSAHPQLAHVRLTSQKPRKLATEPPAFVMLLRKHLEGARLVATHQPGWERIIELGFARGADLAERRASVWLIAEVMGRFSNVILVDAERIILGALRLASAETNAYRVIAPHAPYQPPPPQTRTLAGATLPQLPGQDVTANALREAALDALATFEAAQDGGAGQATGGKSGGKSGGKRARRAAPPTIATVIAASVLGFGRELGREVAARALGVAEAAVDPALPWERWEALAREARALASLAESRAWRPTLVLAPASGDADEAPARPIALAAYEPRQYPPEDELRAVPSVNDALDLFFAGAEWRVELEQAKGDLRRLLQTQRDRCLRKSEALRDEMDSEAEASKLRREAEILLAFWPEVPAGASQGSLPDPYAEDAEAQVVIALDPRLSAIENANRRYDRYHKLQRALKLLPEQVEANELELARVQQLLTDLALAETPAEVSLVRAEVAEAGYIRGGAEARRLAKEQRKGGKKGKPGKQSGKAGAKGQPGKPSQPEGGAPLRRRLSGETLALVGKNSRQNEEITFHQAAPNDLWLHARGAPGAHVILKLAGRPASEETLREAASLAAWYSQLREAGSVAVDYTEARYVRHMKGGGPGMVTYERERTIHAPPADVSEPEK